MKWNSTICALLLGASLAGCNSGEGGFGGFGTGLGALTPDLTQDRDGEYTILLQAFGGPDHVKSAKHYRTGTENRTDWAGLFLVHKADRSQLFWGRYASEENAERNLAKARQWEAPNGQRIYARAIVVRVPGKDDIGPPEWNLRNVTGEHTVVVGEFHNLPAEGLRPAYNKRREDAVKYCRELRGAGEEAYFYHGPAKSLVCIGTFGSGIYKQREDPDTGKILVYLDDPRIKRIQEEYPELKVNWVAEVTYARDEQGNRVKMGTSLTYLTPIPREPGYAPPTSLEGHRLQELQWNR